MQLQLQIMILKSPRKNYHQAVLTERHAPENIYQIENADVAAFASAAAAAASAAVNMLSQNALEQPEELYFSRISFFLLLFSSFFSSFWVGGGGAKFAARPADSQGRGQAAAREFGCVN